MIDNAIERGRALKSYETIPVIAKISTIPEEMLIGKPTSRENALPIRCHSVFTSAGSLHQSLSPNERLALAGLAMFGPTSQTAGWFDEPASVLQPVHPIFHWMANHSYKTREETMTHSRSPNVCCTTIANRIFDLLPPRRLRSMSRMTTLCRIYKKSELLTEEPDEDYVVDDDDEPVYGSKLNPASQTTSVDDIISMMKIEGTEYLIGRIKKIVADFRSCFSVELSPEPARIPPMELAVDRAKWQVRSNSGPPRNQSAVKQKATAEHVQDMLEKEVIEPSTAAHYSHVHLTPKPHQQADEPVKWRFCIDFRALNLVTTTVGQWIPNISQLISRIGLAKPKVFGVILDLTSGYYQAPLHKNSQMFTAFRCIAGIFAWLRVPMGLKGAPAYFQAALATIVLIGLVYTTCVNYT